MSGLGIFWMIVILAFYFGGFAWFVKIAIEAEEKKRAAR